MKKLVFTSIIALVGLAGCGFLSQNKTPEPPPAATTIRVAVDATLLVPCKPIPPLGTSIPEHYLELIGLYGACRLQQDASLRAIKQLSNIKD